MKKAIFYRFALLTVSAWFLNRAEATSMPPDFDWVCVGDTLTSGDSGYRNGSSIAFDADGYCYVTGSFIDTISLGGMIVHPESFHTAFTAKFTPTGDVAWVRTCGSDYGGAIGRGVAVDAQANCFVTGQYQNTNRFRESTGGSGVITNLPWWGGPDVFVAKYNGAGLLLWAYGAGSTNDDSGRSIAVDKQGNCYVTGHFQSTATFGSENLTAPGSLDVFLAKFSPDGVLLWLRQGHASVSASPGHVALDGQGNCYLSGSFRASATFGATTLNSADGSDDIYVAKFDPNGDAQWALRAGGVGSDIGNGVAVSEQGGVYVTGHFNGQAVFFGTSLKSAGAPDVFVLKMTTAGKFQWVRQAGGAEGDAGYRVAVDAGANCCVAGHFRGGATFDTTLLQSSGGIDVFLAKYSAEGSLLWVQQAGGPGDDYALGIGLDSNGKIGLTGGFYGETATFGTYFFASPNAGEAIYVATLRNSCLHFNPASLFLRNDLLHVQLHGAPGEVPVVIEASTDLSHWEDVWTNTPPAGPLDVAAPAPAGHSMRFYRARLGP